MRSSTSRLIALASLSSTFSFTTALPTNSSSFQLVPRGSLTLTFFTGNSCDGGTTVAHNVDDFGDFVLYNPPKDGNMDGYSFEQDNPKFQFQSYIPSRSLDGSEHIETLIWDGAHNSPCGQSTPTGRNGALEEVFNKVETGQGNCHRLWGRATCVRYSKS